jgi:hypothetical protein
VYKDERAAKKKELLTQSFMPEVGVVSSFVVTSRVFSLFLPPDTGNLFTLRLEAKRTGCLPPRAIALWVDVLAS